MAQGHDVREHQFYEIVDVNAEVEAIFLIWFFQKGRSGYLPDAPYSLPTFPKASSMRQTGYHYLSGDLTPHPDVERAGGSPEHWNRRHGGLRL
jgi:hypothetical protein